MSEEQQKKREVGHKGRNKRDNRSQESINESAGRGNRDSCRSIEVRDDKQPGRRDKQQADGREDKAIDRLVVISNYRALVMTFDSPK